jgi:hypothetical protein
MERRVELKHGVNAVFCFRVELRMMEEQDQEIFRHSLWICLGQMNALSAGDVLALSLGLRKS